ncbi:cytosolic carboxypeptidase 2 [Pholidichthys leucotaenia]
MHSVLVEWDPPEPEPFYQPTGHERPPMPVGEDRGKVVYCIATKCPYFTCSRIGGSRKPIKKATSYGDNEVDLALEFESRFESGNLQKAVQVGVYDYKLTLRTDLYTEKHTQWFYFRVRNMKAGVTYRFTITNLMKRHSLYCHGMKPLLYSERAAEEDGVGWQRTGSDIRYYRNCCQNKKDESSQQSDTVTLYSLSWTLQFPYESDTCYLAHCYPYTYSHLQCYLRQIFSNPAVASYCKVRVLCHSLAGNAVYVLTITSQGGSSTEGNTKKAVVVTARVHPGETNGSWMMEGFLDFLLGDSDDARLLRDTFVFKVVPMLNPDGVVVGNYRCSLAGRDLNRYYKTLLRDSFPCVWHTRNMVERLMAETDVILYCDFHGHNRKNNVFMYGCSNKGDRTFKLHERVFPLMMSKNASNKFSFKSCKFRVQKSKEGTGRVVMWRLGIKNSYTMEATFGGSTLGDRRGTHFTTRDLKSVGFYFCDTLLDYCDPDTSKTTYCLTELTALFRKDVRERLGKDLGTDSKVSVSDMETSTSGSNSSDSDGLPVHFLNQPKPVHSEQSVVKKKKCPKSRKERNRLRPNTAKNNNDLKESNLLNDNTIDKSKQKTLPQRYKKKNQVNELTRKTVSPPPPTHHEEASQAALWQGCKPVEDIYQGSLKTPYLPYDTKACSHLSTCTAVPSNTKIYSGDSADFVHSHQQQPQCWRKSSTSSKSSRGLSPSLMAPKRSPSDVCIKMVPWIIPTMHLPSDITTSQSSGHNIFRHRSTLQPSERYTVAEDSSNSNADLTETKLQDEGWKDSSEGSTVIYH